MVQAQGTAGMDRRAALAMTGLVTGQGSVIASAAWQSTHPRRARTWIATACGLAMTVGWGVACHCERSAAIYSFVYQKCLSRLFSKRKQLLFL